MRVEKVGTSGLATVITWPPRIQKVVRDEGEEVGEYWWLPLPRRLGGQLPAGYGGILLLRHGGGDAYQELVARMEEQLRSEVKMEKTQGAAWQWSCFPLWKK